MTLLARRSLITGAALTPFAAPALIRSARVAGVAKLVRQDDRGSVRREALVQYIVV